MTVTGGDRVRQQGAQSALPSPQANTERSLQQPVKLRDE